MKQNKRDFFWTSYVDLMTLLFVVMLVLFVMSFVLFQKEQGRLKVMADQYEKIKQIESALSKLKKEYFEFQSEHKRHVLRKQVTFELGKYEIPQKDYQGLIDAGKEVNEMIKTVYEKEKNVRYILIIEGSSSKDTGSELENYRLSYERALALYQLWQSNNVTFDSNYCEVQVAGSGTRGVGREKEEKLNQRFLIQIIPKVGS